MNETGANPISRVVLTKTPRNREIIAYRSFHTLNRCRKGMPEDEDVR